MPVTIWMRNNVSDALPKTYHQPTGPSMARGTGCRIIGNSVSLKPMRASTPIANFFEPAEHGRRLLCVKRSGRVCLGASDSAEPES